MNVKPGRVIVFEQEITLMLSFPSVMTLVIGFVIVVGHGRGSELDTKNSRFCVVDMYCI